MTKLISLDAAIAALSPMLRGISRSHACNILRALPAAPAVKVKPLVWEYSETTYTADRETGRQEKSGLFWHAYCSVSARSYTIMKLVDPRVKGDKESYRLIIGDTDPRFPSLEAAQDAANAHHRARILSALEGGEA